MTRKEARIYLEDVFPVLNTEMREAIQTLTQEPCEDAISRQDALDCIKANGLKKFDFILDARAKIKNLPSVKPQEPFNIDTYCKEHFCVMVDKDVWEKAEKALKQEPKTGHWKRIGYDIYECSICGQDVMTGDICAYRHCHCCGTRMVSPQESEVSE